ncbi:MAG: GNAT family N-acetyltransferase [Rhodospirillaceae bacterium]|nr:GNAT family N-acetyltransferase [Rhodospirillaceae bacterium]MBT6138217.1 GNAT family N-acetyltransferase [Rhodospirillaceae bacterium]
MDTKQQAQPNAGRTPEMLVRPAGPEDAEALAWLAQELHGYYGLPTRYQRSFMTQAIAAGAFAENSGLEILLAESGDTVLGFLAFSEIFALASCQKSIFIQDLFVTRKTRGSGVGYGLMRALFERARERGIGQIDWTADPWNDDARAFYDRLGPLLSSEKILYRLNGDRLSLLLKS